MGFFDSLFNRNKPKTDDTFSTVNPMHAQAAPEAAPEVKTRPRRNAMVSKTNTLSPDDIQALANAPGMNPMAREAAVSVGEYDKTGEETGLAKTALNAGKDVAASKLAGAKDTIAAISNPDVPTSQKLKAGAIGAAKGAGKGLLNATVGKVHDLGANVANLGMGSTAAVSSQMQIRERDKTLTDDPGKNRDMERALHASVRNTGGAKAAGSALSLGQTGAELATGGIPSLIDIGKDIGKETAKEALSGGIQGMSAGPAAQMTNHGDLSMKETLQGGSDSMLENANKAKELTDSASFEQLSKAPAKAQKLLGLEDQQKEIAKHRSRAHLEEMQRGAAFGTRSKALEKHNQASSVTTTGILDKSALHQEGNALEREAVSERNAVASGEHTLKPSDIKGQSKAFKSFKSIGDKMAPESKSTLIRNANLAKGVKTFKERIDS